ncbi:MAG: hypothetical protein K8R39_06585 [Arcobacteraceae bacterium]|nr:hypothetical protein [Arcobacteraceae bacterium]
MDNELSQLDALIESDVLDALGKEPNDTLSEDFDLDGITIEDHFEDTINDESSEEDNNQETENISEVNSLEEEDSIENEPIPSEPLESSVSIEQDMSSASLSKLLSELLNNKTIEITIKIKE